jgi:uncharacterized tellurite resistance protein B-like protein
MHIILAILGIVAGAAFWWWRIKAVGDAANDAADAAGRIWGKYKRKKFLNKVNDSPLAVIDDPVTAAVVLMHVVVSEDNKLNHASEEAIRREVTETMKIDDPTEMITFGRWTAGHATESKALMLRYTEIWNKNLKKPEREELVGMVERVMRAGTPELATEQRARLDFLRQRLGLLVS